MQPAELRISGFVLDALLGREMHRRRPIAQVVDHREPTATARFPCGRLLAGQMHSVLDPLTMLGFSAVVASLLR